MNIYKSSLCLILTIPIIGICGSVDSIQRMDIDANNGKPLVAHVVVALCDNEFQEIVPVNDDLGNGDSPRTNLYWGAMYGMKTFFTNKKTWRRLSTERPKNPYILDRAVFTRKLIRNKKLITAYVIADAWQGRHIKDATIRFLEMSSGMHSETITAKYKNKPISFMAGGTAHAITYIGHDGLMDFTIPELDTPKVNPLPNSSIVLACYSEHFFSDKLKKTGTHSLLTTNGLMAPEAYTFEAVISSWFSGKSPANIHLAAASSYSKYQKAKLWWSKKLFSTTH